MFTKKGAAGLEKLKGISPQLLAVLPVNPKPWYWIPHRVILNFLLVGPLLGAASVGFDASMMNALQSVAQWRAYFGLPDATILGLINSIFYLGKLSGVVVASYSIDRWGRKNIMMIGFIILCVGALIQATSTTLAQLVISRYIVGIGAAVIGLPAPIIIAELAYPTQRGAATSLYNTSFFIGSIFSSWSTYGTFRIHNEWSWRIPSALQAVIPIVEFMICFFIPESPRWLIANDRADEARKILIKHHAGGDEGSPLVAFEMAEISEAIRLEREFKAQGSYLDLVRTKAYRWRSFIAAVIGVAVAWNGNSILSYYLTLVLNTIGITASKDQTLLNGCLAIFNWLSALLGGAYLVDKFGRRTLWLTSTAGMLLTFIVYTVLTSIFAHSREKRMGYAALVMIFVFSFFCNIAWTPLLQAYPVEIFPYQQRARGVTLLYVSNYLMYFVANFCNPLALAALAWKYYIFFDVILAIILVAIYLVFPETKGLTLEEITGIFEGTELVITDSIMAHSTENVDIGTDIEKPSKLI
ncbi:Lactose permease [Lachnellula subtilissima]|uniref:Lactose permease n=1 Tax=Lachnellula subtilissima TaxID=602034 RepID=A0A8H8U5G6_9HELO|nr:Lactose permease [Lachnellula subtilissima]